MAFAGEGLTQPGRWPGLGLARRDRNQQSAQTVNRTSRLPDFSARGAGYRSLHASRS